MEEVDRVGAKVELIIKPEAFLEFSEIAEENQIDFKILTDDIQRFEFYLQMFIFNLNFLYN